MTKKAEVAAKEDQSPQITLAENLYSSLVEIFLRDSKVTFGAPGKRGFGSSALQINSKIFAMLVCGRFTVKLPRERVDELVASGKGERFDPGHGRPMKEWFVANSISQDEWLALAREAKRFVASIT